MAIAARGGNLQQRERRMVTRGVRPLIGRLHLLGHDMIDTDHMAIAAGGPERSTASRSSLNFSRRD